MKLIIEHKEVMKKYVEAGNFLLESDSLDVNKLNEFFNKLVEKLVDENGENIEIYRAYDIDEISAEIIYEVDARFKQDTLTNYSVEGLCYLYNISFNIADKLLDIIKEEKNGR